MLLSVVAFLSAISVYAASDEYVDNILVECIDSVATECVGARHKAVGGRYMWVPDSLVEDVESVIDGRAWHKLHPDSVDAYEKVIYRGDTIPMVIKQANLGRFDRGMLNYLYIPKGQWQFGLTASYGEFGSENLQLMDLINDVDFGAHSFSIRPYISYAIRHNLCLGMRLAYTSVRADVNSFKVDIDEDMNFNLRDIYYRDESYTAAIVLSQYFGITRRGRFAIYNEVELAFASGNSDFSRPFNGEPKLTHTTYMNMGLNFSPGVSVLMMKNVSFNISFGVFGFYLKNEKQRVDDKPSGSRLTSGANFRFNIFNINFGLAVHI